MNKMHLQAKQNQRHETWNRQTAVGREVGGEKCKKGKGISQRICMNDPQTRTTEWGLTEGRRGRLSGGGQRGKNGTTVTE